MSSNGNYDEALLAAAPAATKAELQEGYNIDLLDDRQQNGRTPRGTPSPHTRTPVPTSADPELAYRNLSKENYATLSEARAPPFWRTRKNQVFMLIAAIIFIGAVVGGAVGGVVSRNHRRNKEISTGQTGQESGSGQIGSDSASSTTTAPAGADSSSSSGTGSAPAMSTSSPPSQPIASKPLARKLEEVERRGCG